MNKTIQTHKEEATYIVIATDRHLKRVHVADQLKVTKESDIPNDVVIELLNHLLEDNSKISTINRDESSALVVNSEGELLDWQYCFSYLSSINGPAIDYYAMGYTGLYPENFDFRH